MNHQTASILMNRMAFVVLAMLGSSFLCVNIRADTLYWNNQNQGTITKATPNGTVSLVVGGLDIPEGFAFDASGNLFVATVGSGHSAIYKFTSGGVGSLFADTGLNNPLGLAVDSAGNVYAANFIGSTIEKFTPDGVGSVFASAGVNAPYGLAFDGAGNLYVANSGDNTIEKFTPGGVGSVFASGGLINGPYGLAFDSEGDLYVADASFRNTSILKFTPDGTGSLFAVTDLTPPAIFSPKGLAVDSAGNVYAGANVIYKFTPDGVGSIFVDGNQASPLGMDPGFLAIVRDATAAPLPGVLPMGCLLGCVFALLRRAFLRRGRAQPI